MTDFNYKKYSLENLENWLHDSISCGDATPQEIYDTIKNAVEEEHHYYKQNASRCDELLTLLNRNDGWTYEDVMKEKEYYEPSAWWYSNPDNFAPNKDDIIVFNTKDKVVKWQLPVQVDGLTGDCFIQFPDDLLEVAGLKEGDTVECIDRGDGSFEMRKVNGPE